MSYWNAETLFQHHPLPWRLELRVPSDGRACGAVPVVVDAQGGEPMRKTAGTAVLVALANRLGDIEKQLKEQGNGQK